MCVYVCVCVWGGYVCVCVDGCVSARARVYVYAALQHYLV